MFLIIIGLTIFFIIAFFVYETAKKNGHNAAIWTVFTVCSFIGAYLALLTAFRIIINIGIGQSIWAMNSVLYVGEIVHLVILGLSMSGAVLILFRVSQSKNKVPNIEEPPPTFDGK